MTGHEIARTVVHAAYCIRKLFGPELHETVYEVCPLQNWRSVAIDDTMSFLRAFAASRFCRLGTLCTGNQNVFCCMSTQPTDVSPSIF